MLRVPEGALIALLVVFCVLVLAAVPVEFRVVRRRRKVALAERIAALEADLGMDAVSIERRWREWNAELLESTKARYRRVVREAVGDTFDAHYARKRRKVLAVFRAHHTNYVQVMASSGYSATKLVA